ncbi:hypothetical protein K491DRAFT_668773 [Lophiostoma macrostomum CBS 122681]|uniref:Integral membrane protein n=1 Tax=Lophiostoma macrostomum CBS 122681 TaxID=1314788 RepID=A0A6A6SSK2_9PLEO|nr:hypothetical protein K491DRAFT_668773 [Lophiostoma macrostomum CBS 122681]
MSSTVQESVMDIPSIAFGFTLGFFVLTGMKIARQSIAMYKRTKRIWNPYPLMCFGELFVNLIFAIITWLYLHGNIPRSFAFLFGSLSLWVFQTQLLVQIIANRVSLVMVDKRKAKHLKIGLAVAVGLVNISVYCVWLPARMEVSATWIHVNDIYDRIEKVIYLLIDLALNLYFLYLVRSRLISRGLLKYKSLFNFNAVIIVASLSMDVLLIGMMSLPNTFIYVQFHPVTYIVKLNIECSMADLISKVVSSKDRTDAIHSDSYSHPTELTSVPRNTRGTSKNPGNFAITSYKASASKGHDPDEISLEEGELGPNGIMKTVATTVVRSEPAVQGDGERGRHSRDDGSVSSSTVQLSEDYRIGAKSSF